MTNRKMNHQRTVCNVSDTIPVPAWKLKALLRIVAECRDPRYRGSDWFRDLAEEVGIDMEQAERLNPEVAA